MLTTFVSPLSVFMARRSTRWLLLCAQPSAPQRAPSFACCTSSRSRLLRRPLVLAHLRHRPRPLLPLLRPRRQSRWAHPHRRPPPQRPSPRQTALRCRHRRRPRLLVALRWRCPRLRPAARRWPRRPTLSPSTFELSDNRRPRSRLHRSLLPMPMLPWRGCSAASSACRALTALGTWHSGRVR